MEDIRMRRIRQVFDDRRIEDIDGALAGEFARIGLPARLRPGMRIGITVGSRGIRNIGQIIAAIIREVRSAGGEPFIIPAMGSHGGATAEGQVRLLAKYGITEEALGVPIRSSMAVVELGKLPNGLQVYFDREAQEADGVIVVNRVKVHTAFKSDIESGLHKMLSVGLGNHQGASLVHALGVKGLQDYMVDFAKVILEKAPILCGVGILENAYDETSRLTAAWPAAFEQVDRELLRECKRILPSLPVSDVDVLLVEEIGKNISGTGMDTNIVGGVKGFKPGEYTPPEIKRIVVLGLSPETRGNALGIGMADLIPRRVRDQIDLEATYANTITATFLDRAKIPMVADTAQRALDIALRTCWTLPGTPPRILLIRNTLKLDELYVSEPVWQEVRERSQIEPAGEWEPLRFNADGELLLKV
jgi:hypothetical protein